MQTFISASDSLHETQSSRDVIDVIWWRKFHSLRETTSRWFRSSTSTPQLSFAFALIKFTQIQLILSELLHVFTCDRGENESEKKTSMPIQTLATYCSAIPNTNVVIMQQTKASLIKKRQEDFFEGKN